MLDILILAVVQGIAEFLPISSSGHLVILGSLLALRGDETLSVQRESLTLEIILHAGTLGSILVVYWRKILRLLTSDRRVVWLLVVGTLPAGIVGVVIKSQFESVMHNPVLAGAMLLVTAAMLLVLGRLQPRDGLYPKLSFAGAFAIGCFQAVAVLPGISRSGSTILGARLAGLRNEDSLTFSFLLAIPAILGATVLTIKDLWDQQAAGVPIEFSPTELAVGALTSFVVGIFALLWLIGWSQLNRLHWFAGWCIPVGIFAIIFFGS